MDSTFIIEKSVVIVVVFAVTMIMAMYSTWAERKVAAFLQDRVGPNRAGFGGLLQPLADGLKLFSKEEFEPNTPNRFLFFVGPAIAMSTALMTSAVIPWGDKLHLFGRDILLQATDLNIGLLYFFGVVSVGVYGIMIGGWASNNKFSLMGAVRAASQMVSYEVAMGLSMIALLMMTGTLSLKEISVQQSGMDWNVFYQPLSFIIFLICAFAETNRTPFDLAECETELVGGYHTEFSAFKLGLFLFAEYINMFVSSAVMAGFYFGGYNFPFAHELYQALGLQEGSWIISLIGFGAYFTKTLIFISVFMWIRWTIPRFRYDQLMNLGWKSLLPLSLLNLLITVIVEYFRGNINL